MERCFRNIFLKYSVENNGNDDDIRKSVRKDINRKRRNIFTMAMLDYAEKMYDWN